MDTNWEKDTGTDRELDGDIDVAADIDRERDGNRDTISDRERERNDYVH
jgi:hypothetical protein